MTVITVFIAGLATIFAGKINQSVAGTRWFGAGLLALCLGSVIALAGVVSSWDLMVTMGIILRVEGSYAIAHGVRRFRSLPVLRWPAAAAAAFAVSIFVLYRLFGPERVDIRIGSVSCAMAILSADAAISMIRQAPVRDRLTYRMTAFGFGIATVFLSARTLSSLAGLYVNGALAVPLEIVSTICADIILVGCAFGMLLASNSRMRDNAERLALFDSLTNLPNRRLLMDRLLAAENRVLETGRRLGIIYLDLDGFKLVNDTLGHEAGDNLLRATSAVMSRMLGPDTCLARVGGDEFVVLVENVRSRGELARLAERLSTAMEHEPISDSLPEPMRASCGFAVFPDDGNSAHDVMREADTAMYHAKRSRVAEFSTSA